MSFKSIVYWFRVCRAVRLFSLKINAAGVLSSTHIHTPKNGIEIIQSAAITIRNLAAGFAMFTDMFIPTRAIT
jgi:hypothetical protein